MTGADRSGTMVKDILDPELRLQFRSSLCLVERDRSTLQIGTDPPMCTVVHNAPPGAADLLKALDGSRTTHQVLVTLSERYRIDPTSWTVLLSSLVASGFIAATPTVVGWRDSSEATCVQADRAALTLRFGPEGAGQAMRNRREAVVQIIGSGRVAASLGSMLAGGGVGHVYIEPARPLRPGDVCAAGVGYEALDSGPPSQSSQKQQPPTPPERQDPTGRHTRLTAKTKRESAAASNPPNNRLVTDRLALAAVLQRVSPTIAVHPPAGYVPPNVIVLAGDGPVDAAALVDLHRREIPHLSIRTSELKAVVGPFVVPGRTSCINCAHLHRTDSDPGWPLVFLALAKQNAVPSSAHAASVAAVGATQVLQFLDGIEPPDTVDGTLEWESNNWQIRRRSWRIHPLCACRR